jgi:hypothetical protein
MVLERTDKDDDGEVDAQAGRHDDQQQFGVHRCEESG